MFIIDTWEHCDTIIVVPVLSKRDESRIERFEKNTNLRDETQEGSGQGPIGVIRADAQVASFSPYVNF